MSNAWSFGFCGDERVWSTLIRCDKLIKEASSRRLEQRHRYVAQSVITPFKVVSTLMQQKQTWCHSWRGKREESRESNNTTYDPWHQDLKINFTHTLTRPPPRFSGTWPDWPCVSLERVMAPGIALALCTRAWEDDQRGWKECRAKRCQESWWMSLFR